VSVLECAREAARRETTEGANLQIDVSPELHVAADRDLLIRVLANLIRNALQHGGAAVPIQMSARREGDEVTISVQDEGPGVPEAELSRIFDAFYRLDHSRTRGTGGTGLGLMIVKTCMESCCGSVKARNRHPQGFEVLVQLSAAEAPKSAAAETGVSA
jgi:two-component system sensor histidine kinase CpxA